MYECLNEIKQNIAFNFKVCIKLFLFTRPEAHVVPGAADLPYINVQFVSVLDLRHANEVHIWSFKF